MSNIIGAIEKVCPLASVGVPTDHGQIAIAQSPCMKEKCMLYSPLGRNCLLWKLSSDLTDIAGQLKDINRKTWDIPSPDDHVMTQKSKIFVSGNDRDPAENPKG